MVVVIAAAFCLVIVVVVFGLLVFVLLILIIIARTIVRAGAACAVLWRPWPLRLIISVAIAISGALMLLLDDFENDDAAAVNYKRPSSLNWGSGGTTATPRVICAVVVISR